MRLIENGERKGNRKVIVKSTCRLLPSAHQQYFLFALYDGTSDLWLADSEWIQESRQGSVKGEFWNKRIKKIAVNSEPHA